MNEERENGRFDPADFIPADAQPKVAVSCELEEPPRGSALTGILGALFGALVGAVMVAGMLTDGQGTGRYAREILLGFRERCGATICKDLKGVETGKVLCPCTECVRNAVLAAGAALGE